MNMPANIRCVQPGERGLFRLERAWGLWRRALLRRFRPGYVRRMAAARQGECEACAHDVIDARDLKLVRNVCGYRIAAEDDAFAWRDRLPFARQGLVEVTVVGGGGLLAAAAAAAFQPWLALPFVVVSAFYLWFFRSPPGRGGGAAVAPDAVLAPADGIVDDLCEVEDCAWLGGRALRLGISLSLFDVHVNRAPAAGTVTAVEYRPGSFRNAMRRGDHRDNEQFWTVLQPDVSGADLPGERLLAVRQIAGPMARTIVNEVAPGRRLERGECFGMIKFGSRTELYFRPDDGYRVAIPLGSRVVAGVTPLLLARLPMTVNQ